MRHYDLFGRGHGTRTTQEEALALGISLADMVGETVYTLVDSVCGLVWRGVDKAVTHALDEYDDVDEAVDLWYE